MAIFLPDVTPTKCTFIPARIPVTEGRLLESAISKRPLSNLPYGSMLELDYTNVDDSIAADFLKVYRNTFNRMFPVQIAPSIVEGLTNADLIARILSPVGLSWFFKEGPEVESIIFGVSSFSITLEALLPGFFEYSGDGGVGGV